jgi:tetratricopeptide (TPR) repeat protein
MKKQWLKVFMKVRAVLPLLVLLSCASAGQNTNAISLDEAIEQSAREFQEKTASPKRIAIVQFDTETEALSEYIMEEITGALVRLDFEVAERRNLDFVRKELDLQYSGDVDDESMVEIGRFIGAESVLVGELLKVGNTYRYRLSSIGVEKAVRETAVRLDVRNDRAFNAILESLRDSKPAAQNPIDSKPVAQPGTAGTFLDRGIQFTARGDFDRAIENFSEAIKLKPNFAAAYNNRGIAYYNKKDYDREIADYTQAIRLDPDYAPAYYNRGIAYNNKGDYDRAIADCTQAIRLDPDYAKAYYNRGNAYYYKGDYDRAITDYDQAIRLNPDHPGAYNNRGNSYRNKGDYDRAIADYNQAIRIDPNNAVPYNNRGNSYNDKGDYDRAIADCTHAIRLDPDYASAYYNRGVAYYNKGDKTRASTDWKKALELDPNNENAREFLELP